MWDAWGREMHLPRRACRGQRAILGDQFSPSTEWVSGIKLKPSGLAAGAFTHGAFGPSYILYMHLIFYLSLYSTRAQQANSRQYDVYCLVNLILGLTSMFLVRLVHIEQVLLLGGCAGNMLTPPPPPSIFHVNAVTQSTVLKTS